MSASVTHHGAADDATERQQLHVRPPPDDESGSIETEPSLDWAADRIQQFDWKLAKAKLAHWLWIGPVKAIFAVIYIAIVRDGFVNLTPVFAMRLSRIPGLSFLRESEMLHTVDIALILSLFLFIVVTYCWSAVFRLWTSGDRKAFETLEDKYAERYEVLIVALSFVVIIAELMLFYHAIVESSWGGSAFSFSALLASAAFVGVLLGVTLIGIHLERNVNNFKLESNQ